MRIRWGALVVVISCMATAVAMAISGQDNSSSDIAGAVEKNHSSANHPGQQSRTNLGFDLSEIKRTIPAKIESNNMFQSKSWYVSPPAMKAGFLPSKSATLVSSPLPPPPPSVPQMPFIFIGRMIDGHEVTLYLSRSNQQYSAKLNDVLDGTYRVDRITDKSAVLTYLPLNIQLELQFNSTAIGTSSLSALASDTSIPNLMQTQQPAPSLPIK